MQAITLLKIINYRLKITIKFCKTLVGVITDKEECLLLVGDNTNKGRKSMAPQANTIR